ncbi:MAG: histidine phosphatase family protein [Magnetococcales bacterium]|nr:histidine phosphatase family protein [Magnetococcales bacterium]
MPLLPTDTATLERSVLFMRHGERAGIIDPAQTRTLLLTPAGIAGARRLGADTLASSPPREVFHSTIPRCRQTAEAILDGLTERGLRPRCHGGREELATPFLPDPQYTWNESWRRGLDAITFVQVWLRDGMDPALADDPRRAALGQLAFLHRQWQQYPGFQLHVSHDWNIVLLTWLLLGLEPEPDHWPGFLEGVRITFLTDGITCRYRDLERTVPATLLTLTNGEDLPPPSTDESRAATFTINGAD